MAVCVPAGAGVGVATGFAVGVGVGFGDWVCMAAATAPSPPTSPPGERNMSPIPTKAVSLRVRPVRMAIGRTDTQFASLIEVSKWGETGLTTAGVLPDAVRRSRRLVSLQFGAVPLMSPAM